MSKAMVVFALYRPHPGKEAELLKLVARHCPTLRKLELITDRAPIVVRAADRTIIEVFEWRSEEIVKRAHEHPEVAAIWEALETVAETTTLASLAEAHEQFSHFEPV